MTLQEQIGNGINDIAKEIVTIDTDGDIVFTGRLTDKVGEAFNEIPREWLSAIDTSFDSMTEIYPLVSFIFVDNLHATELQAQYASLKPLTLKK